METNKDIYKRSNRFTGESIELTKEEAEKHDKIFYHEALATLEDKELGIGMSKHWDKMRKLLNWFRKNNAKAYMALLDKKNKHGPAPAGPAQGSRTVDQYPNITHPTP